jgi:erythromycin esterase-like protein
MLTSRAFRALAVLMLTLLGQPAGAQTLEEDTSGVAKAATPKPILPGIYKVDGADPGLATSDLEPLRKLIGKASVVGLGETVHTSGGVYRLKHRVFRHLVQRLGFRVLALETPTEPIQQAVQYVESCGGSADDATGALLPTWQSEEMRDLLEWMCGWNRAHRKPQDRVHLLGFDVQDFQGQPHFAGANLLAFLGRIDVVAPDPRAAGVLQCVGVDERLPAGPPISDARNQACLEALDALGQLFTTNAAEITRRTSALDLGWARVRLRGIRAWEETLYYQTRDSRLSFEARDGGMADVLLTLRSLLYPKAKTVVWAANLQVSRNRDQATGEVSMGTQLNRQLGRDYLPIAVVGYDLGVDAGSFNPSLCGVKAYHGADSVEAALHDLGEGYLLVDLGFPGGRPPFLAPGTAYPIGDDVLVPRDQYAALFFVDQSPPMAPLGRGPCTPR